MKNLEEELQNQLDLIKIKLDARPTKELAEEYQSIKDNLEKLYEKNIEGIIVRARAGWHEQGEKSTKYFLNLEKRNHVKKHIRKSKINGVIKTNAFEILNEQKSFYKNLYKEMGCKPCDEFLDKLNIPKLTEEEKLSCEGPITEEEYKSVMDSFKNNKTPGNDGVPIEFYKQFWQFVKYYFIDACNEAYLEGELSTSQKQAVITLIDKKNKDRTLITNWRPISLVNVDAKIISKTIASRIKNVLPALIHDNQAGYVKDRYIGEAIRTILDVIHRRCRSSRFISFYRF